MPRLFNERAIHAHTIDESKGTGAVYRSKRGATVLYCIQSLDKGPPPNKSIACLFQGVMGECLAVEHLLTTTYLGSKGTFTRQAAIKHFGHTTCTKACTTVDDCFKLVETRQADYLVIPAENSTEGSTGRTLSLVTVPPLRTCDGVVVRIYHNLLHKDNRQINGICKALAHAQVLMRCND